MFNRKFRLGFFAAGIAALTFALNLASDAQVTNPGVQQVSSVTANHCVKWSGNGQIADAGGTCAATAPVQSVFSRTGNVVAVANDYAFNQISGVLGCTQMPSLLGDVSNSDCTITLATVNANVGTFGDTTHSVQFTVNGKGLITGAADILITPAFSDLTGSLACSQTPALTGDVATSAGSCATAIGSGKVTAGMLASGAAASNLGSAGGDLTGTYPSPTLAAIISAGGPTGSATVAPIITWDAKGRLTVVSSATIAPPFSAVTGQATLAQMPNIATSTVFGNFSGSTTVPSAASVPSCASDGSHTLTNNAGGGFNCTAIAAGGTVTNYKLVAGTGVSTTGDCDVTTNNTATPCTPAVAYGSTSSTATRGDLGVQKVKITVFLTSGTFTPTTGNLYTIFECQGSGGGGGGTTGVLSNSVNAGGGGSGGYSRVAASAATVGASQTVTIGTAGAGGTAGNNNGSAGGDTSVGTLCVGKGGSGGIASGGAGGAAGVTGVGDIVVAGQSGDSGLQVNFGNLPSARGGNSQFGGGGPTQNNGTGATTGTTATGRGAGGGGAESFNSNGGTAAGGPGTAGLVIATEYLNQ